MKRNFYAIHRLRNKKVVIAKLLNRHDVTSVVNHEADLAEIFVKSIVDELNIFTLCFSFKPFQAGVHICPT